MTGKHATGGVMTSRSDWRLMAFTLGLSLALHAVAAWYWPAHAEADAPSSAVALPTLSLEITRPATRKVPAPVTPPVSDAASRETPPEAAKPHPLRHASKAVRSAPAEEPAVPVEKVETAALEMAAIAPAAVPAVDADALRESYRAQLMRHIEAHKYYPAAARRLRMEGSVLVRLVVDCNGAVREQVMEAGVPLLNGAARTAVERAQPLPPPPEGLSCPQILQYAMRYRLAER